MRVIIVGIVAVLASCGPKPAPRDETMPSATLDKQDPTAHYEHHEPAKPSGSWWRNFHPFSGPPDPFQGPADPPHYYTGCGGCASGDPASPLVVALALLFRRQRRPRRRAG